MTTATEPVKTTETGTGPFRPWTMTVDHLERMIEAGVFEKQDRVFLWKGRLVEKMTKGHPHTVAVTRLHHALVPIVAGKGDVVQEGPVRLLGRNDTMPEPDLNVIRGLLGQYATRPTTKDVLMLVEVSDSSLPADRREMLPIYAAESVPIYWIVNVLQRQIEVYTEPSGPTETPMYDRASIYRPGADVPVVLDGVEVGRVEVRAIFPDDDPWLRSGG